MKPVPVQTRWAKEVSPKNALLKYPRPQMVRNNKWENLNGLWEYAITDTSTSNPENYDGEILVPFPIESSLSGVQRALHPNQFLWYRRKFNYSLSMHRERLLLHFGAIDWESTVFVNGKEIGKHRGGYTAFSYDITNNLIVGDNNEIVVKVFDPTDNGLNPHGKQTLNPTNIYYTANSGIWQTVWLEKVPNTYITRLNMQSNIDDSILSCHVNVKGNKEKLSLQVEIHGKGKLISKSNHKPNLPFSIKIRNRRLWSPDDPYLYDITIKLMSKDGVVDQVSSYFGMRKISIEKDKDGMDHIFLNNSPYYNLGTLDQGYWPEGIYTAPTDDALKFDIMAIKAMGFNTIRKHIKVEPDRWYFYADKIGVLVWQDFVNPPHNLPEGASSQFEIETKEIMQQLHNYSCITTWVVFNERWGVYDQERIANWIKKMDSSRLINAHSGELLYVDRNLRAPSNRPYLGSDMTDVHAYPEPMLPPIQPGKAMVCGEFGGLGVSVLGHQWNDMFGWGYVQVDPKEFETAYRRMIDSLKLLKKQGLSGSIYTQPYDVEGEENGLLSYDRSIIKIPLNRLRSIHGTLVKNTHYSKGNHYIKINNIDTADSNVRYYKFSSQFKNGRRDSAFLRNFILLSMYRHDSANVSKASTAYIRSLKSLYTKDNLSFIRYITKSPIDTGFKLFLNSPSKVNYILGKGVAEGTLRSIISKKEIDPLISDSTREINWDQLAIKLKGKYELIGEEEVFGRAMIYFHQKNDWSMFGKYYDLYYRTAYSNSEYHINNFSWEIFIHISDVHILKSAVTAMKYNIEVIDINNPYSYDTYANLLYKLGDINEALKWEQKALDLLPNNEDFKESLKKMKEGIPTWTVSN